VIEALVAEGLRLAPALVEEALRRVDKAKTRSRHHR